VRLLNLPVTFIHGEFYASNVMVDGDRIRPIDWETAAVGPAMMDLAALCAGKLDDGQRDEIIDAYGRDNADGLDECRLQLAIQWLGWSKDWTPPKDQQQDWLAEAMSLAGKLGIA
jgi:thiamine kinase-like enzyme